MSQPNSEGRKANAAQPLGERPGLVSKSKTESIGKHSTAKGGPEGGSAADKAALQARRS